jgi:hypothetical protein
MRTVKVHSRGTVNNRRRFIHCIREPAMSDPNRPNPTPKGDSEPRDPIADRAGEASGVESPGTGAEEDPDALDQTVGRGDARSGDGAI